MRKTIVVYGSTTGTCQKFAAQIAQKLGVSDVKMWLMSVQTLWLSMTTFCWVHQHGVLVSYRMIGTTVWKP